MYLFFDTETTGLPRNWKAPVSNSSNWPRMVQLAWLIYDETGNRIDGEDFIIIPEGFTIPAEASKVHGITTERAHKDGYELDYVLQVFADQIEKADSLVAHNIAFDEKIVGAEFYRKRIPSNLFNKPRLCTMKNSTNYCRIPGPYGYKWPKLSELHIKLFDEDFEDAHDAAADINATAKCFWKMRDIGLI